MFVVGGKGGGGTQKPSVWTQHYVVKNYVKKSLSEALLSAEHRENMLCKKIVLNVRNNFCTQHVLPRFELGIFMYVLNLQLNEQSVVILWIS